MFDVAEKSEMQDILLRERQKIRFWAPNSAVVG